MVRKNLAKGHVNQTRWFPVDSCTQMQMIGMAVTDTAVILEEHRQLRLKVSPSEYKNGSMSEVYLVGRSWGLSQAIPDRKVTKIKKRWSKMVSQQRKLSVHI